MQSVGLQRSVETVPQFSILHSVGMQPTIMYKDAFLWNARHDLHRIFYRATHPYGMQTQNSAE